MSVVTNNIIGIDQTCALKGRSILDNAHLHRNVVDYCLSLHTFLTNGSKHKTYSRGDKLHPCLTEREILTG
jgi:hypothetical protein